MMNGSIAIYVIAVSSFAIGLAIGYYVDYVLIGRLIRRELAAREAERAAHNKAKAIVTK